MQVNGQGYIFNLKTTDARHIGGGVLTDRVSKGDIVSEFGTMFKNAIDSVNDKQVQADNLIIEAGIRPDQVDISDVMNAISEADLSLSLTKAVVDRAVRAYQELTTAR